MARSVPLTRSGSTSGEAERWADKENDSMRRIGETQKCPACGCRMDADAYRCPNCRIYFCFKCRARVSEHEQQYQCSDQSCKYYAKLLCHACVAVEPVYGDHTEEERVLTSPGEHRKTAMHSRMLWANSSAIGVLVLVWFFFSFMAALVTAALSWIGIVVYTSRRKDFNWDGTPIVYHRDPTYETKYTTTKVRTGDEVLCIECRHPVKHLR